MAIFHQKTVLVAPLDWGLGHATRCIPIIENLQLNGCKVIIAAEKATLNILTEAFPAIQKIPLHGYRIHYGRTKNSFFINLLFQIPKSFLRLYFEHRWLKKVVKTYKIDAIISDNRFGLYHHLIPCVYITHQLSVQTGNQIMDKLVQKIHFAIIKKFTHCWVPDYEERESSLAGILSHPSSLPSNVVYIGCLSRFKEHLQSQRLYSIVAVISGPEPQRTIFEKILLAQLQQFKGKSMLVRGLPEEGDKIPLLQNDNLEFKNHLSMQDLNAAMLQADWVIARSGYTTVMDLVKIRQKAILVPTPGQTEQVYLADYLYKKQYFFTAAQLDFNVTKAIEAAKIFPSSFMAPDMDLYKQVITTFVQSL